MGTKLDHVAIYAKDVDWYIDFFDYVFGLKVSKWNDDKTQLWLDEMIQLIKGEDKPFVGMDHICLKVDNVEEAIEKAYEKGSHSMEKGKNWVVIPTGLLIEII